MIIEIDKNSKYILLRDFKGKPVFIACDDECAKQAFRDKHKNRNLSISPDLYTDTDLSAEQICPLRFHIIAENLAQARINAIESCYYINEKTSVPLCIAWPEYLQIPVYVFHHGAKKKGQNKKG